MDSVRTAQSPRNGFNRADVTISLISYLLLTIPLAVFYLSKGMVIVGDAIYYVAKANQIIEHVIDGQAISAALNGIDPFYSISIGLLAILKYLFGENWQTAILLANAVFYGFCAPSVYLLYRLIGGKQKILAAIFSALLPLAYPEVLFLGNIPLRDIPLAGISSLATFVIVWLATKKAGLLSYCVCSLICIMLTAVRPNAIIFFIASAVIFYWVWSARAKTRPSSPYKILLVQLACSFALLCLAAWWFNSPHPLPFASIDRLMRSVLHINQAGFIIIDHQDIIAKTPDSFFDYLYLLLLKFIYYFRYWNPMHSMGHYIYRHIYFGAIFINFIYVAVAYLRPQNLQHNCNLNSAILFCLSLAFAGAAFHSVIVLAFEFRYQMLIFPVLWAVFLFQIIPLVERLLPGHKAGATANPSDLTPGAII